MHAQGNAKQEGDCSIFFCTLSIWPGWLRIHLVGWAVCGGSRAIGKSDLSKHTITW
jgi:hypothetical protein